MAENEENKTPEKKKKKEGKLGKLLMGVVIGGAVGSVLGVTLSDKDNRDYIKKKSLETWDKSRIVLGEIMNTKKTKTKESLWHKLHQIFVKKDDDDGDEA